MAKIIPTLMTRGEAYSKGLRTYYTGVACRRGHLAPRTVAQGACTDCLIYFKGANAKNPYTHDLIPYTPRGLWRPKHWDFETLERFHAAVQKFIDSWDDAPPAPASNEIKKFRDIYGTKYFTATSVKDTKGVEHELWFTFNKLPRDQMMLRHSSDDSEPAFPVFNEAALGDLPLLLVGDRWFALNAAKGVTYPLVRDEHLNLMLTKFGE